MLNLIFSIFSKRIIRYTLLFLLCVTVFFVPTEYSVNSHQDRGSCKNNNNNYWWNLTERQKPMKAFVVGATGGVGKHLVRELAKNGHFETVTLITRRLLNPPEGVEEADLKKIEQKIVDFDKLEENHAADFEGFDVGFCALGTTRGKSGKEGFIKVDHDYVVASAKLAKAGGCKHFQLVSSGGANKNSWFLYPQVKGQVEEEIADMKFDRLTIWRPALLIVDRDESRPAERFIQCIAGPLDRGRFLSIEVPKFAKVMVDYCSKQAKAAVEIIANRDIHFMSQEKSS